MWGSDPYFSSPSSKGRSSPTNTPMFPLVPSSYRVLHGSIYSFPLGRYLVCSQLVFCMHFCVWRCIPDVSVERDVLHLHLSLRHLVLWGSALMILSWPLSTSKGQSLHSSSSRLLSPLQNFLNHHCSVHSLAIPGPNELFMFWVVSAALQLILNSNKQIAQICLLSKIISII